MIELRPYGYLAWATNPIDAVWGYDPVAMDHRVLAHEVSAAALNGAEFEQASFEDSFGYNAQGRVVYSAMVPVGSCSLLSQSEGFLDSVWLDRTVLAINGWIARPGSSPDPDLPYVSTSCPGVTVDGRAFWHGAAAPAGQSLPQWEALLIESPAGPVVPWVSTGLSVDGGTLKSFGPFSVSHIGGYAICTARLEDDREVLVRAAWDDVTGDPYASPATIGGVVVAEGRLVNALGKEAGDRWQRLLHVGAGESADPGMPPHWFVLAQIGSESASDHAIVMSNGLLDYVGYREGQNLDNDDQTGPRELLGGPTHVAINPQGDVAHVWRVDPGNKQALFLNDVRLIETGAQVPMRNGSPGTLTNILGVNTVSISGRSPATGEVSVYFIANVRQSQYEDYTRVQTLYRIDYTVSTGKICSADWDLSGQINSGDISAFLTSWLADLNASPQGTLADYNNDGVTNSGDISAFLTAWLAGVGGAC